MNPKKHNTLSHKIAVLASLMVETLDEIQANSEIALEFKNKSKELLPFCEIIQEDSYLANQVKSSTYLSELSSKVDTVIRKSYQRITD